MLEYDDVMSKQRELIYDQRRTVLDNANLKETVSKMIDDFLDAEVGQYLLGDEPEQWNFDGLHQDLDGLILSPTDLEYTQEELEQLQITDVADLLKEKARAVYARKEQELGEATMREAERVALLTSVDTNWIAHLDDMEDLKQSIGLEQYAQRNPVVEFKLQGFDLFESMIENIKSDTARAVLSVQPKKEEPIQRRAVVKVTSTGRGGTVVKREPVRVGKKVGPNEPCPCGSGKKYKKCCGAPGKNNND